MGYSRGMGLGGVLAVIVVVSMVLLLCAVAAGVGGEGITDNILSDRQSERAEQMRQADVAEQRQKAREAEAEAEAAAHRLEQARADAEAEKARERQEEARVEQIRAEGDRAESVANAYTTERMADAAYHAIQRQGRLLSLSHYQYMFFGGILMVALMVNGALALTVVAKRKEKEKQVSKGVVT